MPSPLAANHSRSTLNTTSQPRSVPGSLSGSLSWVRLLINCGSEIGAGTAIGSGGTGPVTKSRPHDSQNKLDSGLTSPHDGQLTVANPVLGGLCADGVCAGGVDASGADGDGDAGSEDDAGGEDDEEDAVPGVDVPAIGAPHVSHQSGSLETWPFGQVVMVVPHLACD